MSQKKNTRRIFPDALCFEKFGFSVLVGGQAGLAAPVARPCRARGVDINGVFHTGNQVSERVSAGRVLHDHRHRPGRVRRQAVGVDDRTKDRVDPGLQLPKMFAMFDNQSLRLGRYAHGLALPFWGGNPLKIRFAKLPLHATVT